MKLCLHMYDSVWGNGMKDPASFAAIDLAETPTQNLSAQQKQLRDFWSELRRNDVLPARDQFTPSDLLPWLSLVSLVDVSPAPRRFRWRLIGSRIVEFLGRDSSGRWFDEVYDAQALKDFNAAYSLCVDRRRPVAFRGTVVFAGKDHIGFRMLQLPLATNGSDVDMLMLMLDFSPET